jgi:hypothetical protein
MPGIQNEIYKKLQLLLKELDTDASGNLKNSITNLKTIGSIKTELEKVILNKQLKANTTEYADAFSQVAKLQNDYFRSIETEFTPSKILDEIKSQSITATIESLTGAGLSYNVIEPVQSILRTNITTGGSFSSLMEQMRTFIVTSPDNLGALERHVKTTTTDALNQFSRQYSQTVSESLNYNWFMYTGSLLETSREFCKALVKKKYFHKSEIPDIINGNFSPFEKSGNMNPKTGLPKGMVENTNPQNFFIYAGGYGCGHQLSAVQDIVVPASIRALFD